MDDMDYVDTPSFADEDMGAVEFTAYIDDVPNTAWFFDFRDGGSDTVAMVIASGEDEYLYYIDFSDTFAFQFVDDSSNSLTFTQDDIDEFFSSTDEIGVCNAFIASLCGDEQIADDVLDNDDLDDEEVEEATGTVDSEDGEIIPDEELVPDDEDLPVLDDSDDGCCIYSFVCPVCGCTFDCDHEILTMKCSCCGNIVTPEMVASTLDDYEEDNDDLDDTDITVDEIDPDVFEQEVSKRKK